MLKSKNVVLFVVVVLVLAVLFFGGGYRRIGYVHAESSYKNFNTLTHVDIPKCCPPSLPCQDTLRYLAFNCPPASGNQSGKDDKRNQDHEKVNTLSSSVEPLNPVVVIDDNGQTLPDDTNNDSDGNDSNGGKDDKTHTNNGNHYGNEKGDFNCHDQKNKHNTCKVNQQTAFGLFVSLLLLQTGKIIRMDGVRSVEPKKDHAFTVTVSKMVDDDIVFYDVPDSSIDNVFLSESPFHHVDEDIWNQYIRD